MKSIGYCSCGNLWENPDTGLCASCSNEQRKNERAASKVKVIRQVQKVTLKRSKELQEYSKLRREYLEANPVCGVDYCFLKAVEVHHKGTRTNQNLNDTEHFFGACKLHHDLITIDSKWAKDHGYSEMRTTNAKK